MEQKTVTAKSAAGMAAMINDAISRNRIPVIVADQPAIAAMIVNYANVAQELSANKSFSESAIVEQIRKATEHRAAHGRVGHVVIIKSSKVGAGSFDGGFFVKIISNRLHVTLGSLANFLVGGE